MESVLGDAGIRLRAVVCDPHGVAARAMIDCLLNGGTPQVALAHAGRLRAPREELAAALEGELTEEHLFVARMICVARAPRTLIVTRPSTSKPSR